MKQVYDPHYLRAIADMGERRAVVTSEAIFAQNDMKLVDAGVRVDSRLYERLVQHRLKAPVEQSLIVDDALDAAALRRHAERLIAERPFCTRLAAASPEVLLRPLSALHLPQPMAFRLTLMQEQRPDLFFHSMQMTLVALFLGARQGLSEAVLAQLAAAALLHDVGVLHIDPTLLQAGHQLNAAERRHLFAHPLTGMLIVQKYPDYAAAVGTAILEHHERLDGSGYPRGLRGDEISPLGRILLLAEVVSAMFERNWDAPGLRLSLVLRLNHRKFDQSLVDRLAAVLREESEALPNTAGHTHELQHLVHLHEVFRAWERLAAPFAKNPPPANSAAVFLQARLDSLGRSMIEAGVQPDQLSFLSNSGDDDPEATAELVLLGREALWQLENVQQEIQRRWPGLAQTGQPADRAVTSWCEWLQGWLK